jgi:hypothetical protein
MLIAKRKFRHYFNKHPFMVVSSSTLGDVIKNHESSIHITKWGLELMGLNISFVLHFSIKS